VPWDENRYPASMSHLPVRVRRKAIEIANALLEEGYDEGKAIRIAIAKAKDGRRATSLSPDDDHGYRVMTREGDGKYVDPDAYLAQATQKEGSWWLEWRAWLERRSGEPVAPPPCGAPGSGHPALADAPGTYVLEK
jgi:hypothetical protein